MKSFIFEDIIKSINVDSGYTSYGEHIHPPHVTVTFGMGTTIGLVINEDQINQLMKMAKSGKQFEVTIKPK